MRRVTTSTTSRASGPRASSLACWCSSSARRIDSARFRKAATTGATDLAVDETRVTLELPGEQSADGRDLPSAGRHLRLGKSPHVLHVEQADAFDLGHRGIDVAGHGEVDHQQGPAGARPHRPADTPGVEHEVGRGGRGQHDVRPRELLVQLPQVHRLRPGLLGDGCGTHGGAVRYNHAGWGGPLRERPGEPGPHLACPDDEYRPPTRPPSRCSAARATAAWAIDVVPCGDRGLGAHALSGLDGVAEQRQQNSAGRLLVTGKFGRGPHLVQDLALTEDRGVDAGCNLEQVGDGRLVDPAGEELRNSRRVGAHRTRTGTEEALDVGQAVMKALDDCVDLGTKARGEDDGLGDVLAVAEHLQGLRQVALGYRDLLEDIERHVPFVDPHGNDRHGAVTSFLSGDSLRPSPRYKGASSGMAVTSGCAT